MPAKASMDDDTILPAVTQRCVHSARQCAERACGTASAPRKPWERRAAGSKSGAHDFGVEHGNQASKRRHARPKE